MDGSTAIIAVYGQPNVGKTSFIARCLNIDNENVYSVTKSSINVCGRDINIQVIENPEQITRAVLAIMLYDISSPETFLSLSETFDKVHRLCPTAYIVVIGTKADLRTSECVTAQQAETFCKNFQDGNVQYYETTTHTPDAIPAIFKEILARPLINIAVLKIATVQENTAFVHDTMDWALENGSANILTHLRDLGYAIPEDLVLKYQELVVFYLLQEYPLKQLPSFRLVRKPSVDQSAVDSELDEDDEPMDVVDHYRPLRVTKTDFLDWSDISLTLFPSSFLTQNAFNLKTLSHIDLSRNSLSVVPVELFLIPGLIFLNISDNQITSLPSPSLWMKTRLEILMLFQNRIVADATVIVPPKSYHDSRLFSKLWYLDISKNALSVCPGWIFALRNLKHLDLSDNMIQVLPAELGNMEQLTTLLIEGLPLVDPPPPIPTLGTQIIRRYLHLKSQSSQPLNCMRVIVVGPTEVGKTMLLNCIRGDSDTKAVPTKGLEVTHWHYKGELLRRKAVNIDFWDFSGSPKYKQIYSCFSCQDSLHLAVFSIHTETAEIIQWLSDIQSFSKERIPVLIVFTHMDTVPTKEMREDLKRKRTEWIKYSMTLNQQLDNSNTFTLLSSTMQTVKSLQDTSTFDRHTLYNPPQQAFDRQEYSGNSIPLMPLVLQNPYFVSCSNNDGISQLRKTLYRIGTGSFQSSLPSLNTIIIDVPNVYIHIINLIKQLQGHLKTVKTEGEQKPFYTFSELLERLRRPIKQLNITGEDFLAALRFLHKRGIVYIFDNTSSSYSLSDILIAINPQIIGYLLQRTMRAGEAHSEGNVLPGFLPNVHPNMIWGVDPIVNLIEGGGSHGISPTQLINFLSYVNILAPVVPGACIVPSLLPVIPVEGTSLDLNDLECKRVYLLGYLPTFFWSHAVTRILQGLKRHKLIEGDEELVPSSPSVAPTRSSNPLVTPTGMKLYLWQKNFILEDNDKYMVWVHALEGGQLGPESTPFCGRIDILIKAPRVMEAVYLRVITTEIDQLLEDRYPSLLDDSSTPIQVEIFIPLTPQWFSNVTSPVPSVNTSSGSNTSGPVPVPEPKTRSVSSVSVARSDMSITVHGTLQEAFVSVKNTGTLPLHSGGGVCGSPRQSFSAEGNDTQSNTSTELEDFPAASSGSQLSYLSLSSTPSQYLVPMWECIQEVYKPPSLQLKNGTLDFQGLLPDLLYADFTPSSFIAIPESYMTGVKKQEDRGMFMRYYYTSYSGEQNNKVMGAIKTFSLQSHVIKLGSDYNLLKSFSCPYIISPTGINISPPVMGLNLAPLGSLKEYMTNGDKPLLQSGIHQIGLQVLSAIEYLDALGLSYHFITAENVFMWCADPVLVKLSDAGLTHDSISCKLCADLKTTPSNEARKTKGIRFNLIMFGLILYEISVGERPLQNVMSFSSLVLNLYHMKAVLNIEAAITHKCHETDHQLNGKDQCVKACHVLCLQTVLDLCTTKDMYVSNDMIRARLSLCAGEENWGPLKLTLDIECMLANRDSSLVYWASGSRGLVVGTINPVSGDLYRHILAEAPTPESGLFANRRGKPIPIAVGHATAIDVCFATNQLWVGTENGLMGSVYVFDLPDMKSHHYIHLQDAVLSLKVVNDEVNLTDTDKHQYHVLVGLANGTIILFMGKSGGQPLKNPLQGPRKVIVTTDRKPCLSISITSSGHFWCGCGNSIEVIESSSLRSLHRHQCLVEDNGGTSVTSGQGAKVKGDVIVLMGMNSRGIWTVTRRSTVLRLWNSVTGELKVSFNVRNILEQDYNEVSALLVDGGVVWVGTRNGFLMLLDASAIERGEHEGALRALQYCGDGRIKSLASLKNKDSSSLRVLCSVEYPDEVSGCLMRWEYQSVHPWQPKETMIVRSSMFELKPIENEKWDKSSQKITSTDPMKSI